MGGRTASAGLPTYGSNALVRLPGINQWHDAPVLAAYGCGHSHGFGVITFWPRTAFAFSLVISHKTDGRLISLALLKGKGK